MYMALSILETSLLRLRSRDTLAGVQNNTPTRPYPPHPSPDTLPVQLLSTSVCAVGKRAVDILLECFLVVSNLNVKFR